MSQFNNNTSILCQILDSMKRVKITVAAKIDELQADDRIALTKDQALDLLGFDKKKYKII